MKIAIACDHGALDYKNIIKVILTEQGYEVVDCGTNNDSSCDYPDFAYKAAKLVASKEANRAIVLCGTGIGVSIVANKVKGIRCALCNDSLSARLTREHNDSNVLALGQRIIGEELMKDIVNVWLNTDYSDNERHTNRINKIKEIEEKF